MPFPFCAETDPKFFREFTTPNDEHFVRSHSLVPAKEPLEDYELTIVKFGEEIKTFGFEDLKNLKAHSVVNTFSCAGNRRRELQ